VLRPRTCRCTGLRKALRRFETWGIDYIVWLQKNSALLEHVALAEHALREQYQAAGASNG